VGLVSQSFHAETVVGLWHADLWGGGGTERAGYLVLCPIAANPANRRAPGFGVESTQWKGDRISILGSTECAKNVWTGKARLCLDCNRRIQRGFMRVLAAGFVSGRFLLFPLMIWGGAAAGQNPPANHVIIPNPTPRQPDLEQVYGDDSQAKKKREALSIQNQLRAREIWLESNQILLLAQQLEQDVLPGKKSASMAASAAKVGKIEKLAQSVQKMMKTE